MIFTVHNSAFSVVSPSTTVVRRIFLTFQNIATVVIASTTVVGRNLTNAIIRYPTTVVDPYTTVLHSIFESYELYAPQQL